MGAQPADAVGHKAPELPTQKSETERSGTNPERDRTFDSGFLRRRVCKFSVPLGAGYSRSRSLS